MSALAPASLIAAVLMSGSLIAGPLTAAGWGGALGFAGGPDGIPGGKLNLEQADERLVELQFSRAFLSRCAGATHAQFVILSHMEEAAYFAARGDRRRLDIDQRRQTAERQARNAACSDALAQERAAAMVALAENERPALMVAALRLQRSPPPLLPSAAAERISRPALEALLAAEGARARNWAQVEARARAFVRRVEAAGARPPGVTDAITAAALPAAVAYAAEPPLETAEAAIAEAQTAAAENALWRTGLLAESWTGWRPAGPGPAPVKRASAVLYAKVSETPGASEREIHIALLRDDRVFVEIVELGGLAFQSVEVRLRNPALALDRPLRSVRLDYRQADLEALQANADTLIRASSNKTSLTFQGKKAAEADIKLAFPARRAQGPVFVFDKAFGRALRAQSENDALVVTIASAKAPKGVRSVLSLAALPDAISFSGP